MPISARTGVDNLIDGCLGAIEGKAVGLVVEKPELGWYEPAIADLVEECIAERGGNCRRLASDGPANEADPSVTALEAEVDALVFLCRSGDQGRFERKAETKPVAMCYARTLDMLAGPFGSIPHGDMVDLKKAIDRVCVEAGEIEVTCPAGTRIRGSVGTDPPLDDGPVEVGIQRFPMCVPQPLNCEGFSGTVVVEGPLTTTGSRVYKPAAVTLDGAITITLEGNIIASVDGSESDQALFRDHYRHVAGLFGLEPFFAHSFHAGIHPGLDHAKVPREDADYWANTAFGSPHYLHFHTCGTTPPGEISWMIAEPTVRLDGVALWDGGELRPMAFGLLSAVLEKSPTLREAFPS